MTTMTTNDKAALDALENSDTRLPPLGVGRGTLVVQGLRCIKSFSSEDVYVFDFLVRSNAKDALNAPGTLCSRVIKISGPYPEPKLREVKTILSCWFGRQLSRDDLARIRKAASREATEDDLAFLPTGREVNFHAVEDVSKTKREKFLRVDWSAAPRDALAAAVDEL